MERVRVAGIIKINGGFAYMHRKNVKKRKDIQLLNEKMNINSELGFGLAKLIAVAENYPDLKANQNFSNLMQELSMIEEDIANSRKYYNGTVREFNTFIQLFPTNIVAAIFGFKAENLFEIDDKQRENVKVSF